MRTLIVFVALAASAGCLRSTKFQCDNDTACGAQGVCESSGFCSFIDPDCTSGRRYADSAGPNAGQCTSDNTGSDGGTVDTPTNIDASLIDGTTSVGCPAGYNAVAGAGTHLYKLVTATGHWDTQQAGCRATTLAANLFVPDDLTELMAIDAVAGFGAYWIGVNDMANENTWVSVPNNTAQTFLPWAPQQPDNAGPGQGEDCVAVTTATHQFSDERCTNTNLPAICECVP